ncbi:MAG: hypothetical protein ACLTC8_10130 [Lachnospiraceae bacterium]
MFPKQNLERKLNVQIATSGVMDNAISLWLQMYENKPPWMGGEADTRTMNLPVAIAEEFSRLILTEFEFKLEGVRELISSTINSRTTSAILTTS